jgi:hypothetical protein
VNIKEVPVLMRISLVLLALICIFGGLLLIPEVRNVFLTPAVRVLISGMGGGV